VRWEKTKRQDKDSRAVHCQLSVRNEQPQKRDTEILSEGQNDGGEIYVLDNVLNLTAGRRRWGA
jgi:hypothetical protein